MRINVKCMCTCSSYCFFRAVVIVIVGGTIVTNANGTFPRMLKLKRCWCNIVGKKIWVQNNFNFIRYLQCANSIFQNDFLGCTLFKKIAQKLECSSQNTYMKFKTLKRSKENAVYAFSCLPKKGKIKNANLVTWRSQLDTYSR